MTAEPRGGGERAAEQDDLPAAAGGRGLDRLGAVPIGRLAGFLGLPLISAVAPFLVLPVLLGHVGTAAWAGIAIGQSVGTGVSSLVMIGWPVVGPSLVAANPERQRALYTQSVISRLTLFCLAAPVGMTIAGVLAPRSAWVAAALMALASSMLGLSASWFFIGTGRPSLIARFETVPRVAATAAAAVLVTRIPWAWLYPAALVLTSSVLVVVVSARYWERGRIAPFRTTLQVARQQWAAAGVSAQAALNTMLPMTLLALVAPAAVAGFAALDRITKFVTFALAPVGQAFQGWVAEPCPSPAQRRRTALVITTGAGLAVAAGFVFAADPLLRILFAAKIEVSGLAILFEAVSIVGIALGMTLGFHYLVPLKMSSWLALSTAVSIVVGAASILLFAPRFGVTGGALSTMLAEVCVCTTQAMALLTRRVRRRSSPAPSAVGDVAS